MPKGILLLADNDLDFLKTRAELLEKKDYCVLTAASPMQAKAWARIKLPIKSEEEAYSSNRHETYRV